MAKVISCGVLVKYGDRYILGHVTGCEHWDIFKGRQDEGETDIQTALRECEEESSLVFTEDRLHFLGHFIYTKAKDLTIYITKLKDVEMTDLNCTTLLENGKPEIDYYNTFSFDDMIGSVGKSMSKVLKDLETTIKDF